MTEIRLIEGYTRDLGIPADWIEQAKSGQAELYNAARPFPCHQNTQGEFIHGVFYGLIFPGQEYADEYRQRAISLDASKMVFVSQAEVEAWGRAYCAKYKINYEDFDFTDIAKSYLQHAREKNYENNNY